jgi:hypothetical protein
MSTSQGKTATLLTKSRTLSFPPPSYLFTSDSSSNADYLRHIHWYERLWPITGNGSIDKSSIVNNNTYFTNPGVSMTHIINGAAGNLESHSTLDPGDSPLNITAVLDFEHYGFTKLRVLNATALSMSYIMGDDGSVRDELTVLKRGSPPGSNSTASTSATGTGSAAPSGSSVVAANEAGYMNISFVISLGGLITFMISCL